ncbi:unnamed protein product [Parnassius apollo]|uniref:(apollo) hypothetical protein n=1 Tax=Parnassius apollo TaxID=110799 RepID=A0A8S3WD77_PARAO|nr:unnamed protein product [Parnassius apollo]
MIIDTMVNHNYQRKSRRDYLRSVAIELIKAQMRQRLMTKNLPRTIKEKIMMFLEVKETSPTVILSPSPQKSIPTTNTISTRPEIDNTSCKRLNQHENINQYYNLEEPYIDGIAPLANEFVLESISNNNHEETITTPILPCSSTSVASANVINLPTPPIASENNKVVAPEIEATVSQPLLVTESNHKPRKRQRNMDMWTKVKIKKLRNIGAQPQKCMREPCAEAEVF